MLDPHWEDLKQIFHGALALAPRERPAYLEQASNGDRSLRLAVESLIKSHEEENNFVDAPAYQAAAEMLIDSAEFKAGQTVAHYRIVSLLGEGGMGAVYLAEDTKLRRKVSLKFLSTNFTEDHERLPRFELEARAISALNDPNTLTIHEINETDGRRFIATEYVEGQTLRERLSSGLETSEALDIAIQVTSALVAAHRVDIVHRDIKPENIMIRDDDGLVKVLDFGLAKMSAPRSAKIEIDSGAETRRANTAPGVVMGTVAYLSPEQARGEAVDQRTDIWSLGVVLYEMIAGSTPFVAPTSNEIISGILSKELAPPLTRYSRLVPERLEEIVEKILTKNRDARYQTSKDLLIDLKRLRQSLEDEKIIPPASQQPVVEATLKRSDQAAVGVESEAHTTGVPARKTDGAESPLTSIKEHKRIVIMAAAILLILLAGGGYALYKLSGLQPPRHVPTPLQSMRITRLTDNGKATAAAISPDGNYVVYVREDEGKFGLWLRQVGSATEREIVPPMDGQIVGTTFSRDGSLIFYTALAFPSPGVLHQVPTLGGTSRKVLENISGPVGLSRDGKRLAFIRSVKGAHHVDSLIVANVDGTGEQILVRKEGPAYLDNGPTWSPDGKTIVCGAAVEPDFQFESIVVIPVDGGQERWMTSHRWSHVSRTVWLGDGSGLMILALENHTAELQLWHISYPGGEVQRVTNDLNGYLDDSLSITADSRALVAAHEDRSSKIWVAPTGEGEHRAKQLTSGKFDGLNGVAWTPDGKILCVLKTGDDTNIWLMNRDGTERKQLTADSAVKMLPQMSPDGRHIVFDSVHGEPRNIWRIDADGGNQKQLTRGAFGDFGPQFTPDGQSVIFWSWTESGSGRIKKVSIDGGDPVQLTDYRTVFPTVSPDGKLIAAVYLDEQQSPHLAIVPSVGGQPIKLLPLLHPSMSPAVGFAWTPDSSSLVYPQKHNGVSNIWGQPINGDPPRQLTNFKSDLIFGFALSADGRQLVLARGTQTHDVVLIRGFR